MADPGERPLPPPPPPLFLDRNEARRAEKKIESVPPLRQSLGDPPRPSEGLDPSLVCDAGYQPGLVSFLPSGEEPETAVFFGF